MATKKAITIEDLKKSHGDSAAEIYNQICNIGGFGQVGADFYGGKPPLDINGCDPKQLAEIEKILTKEDKK